MFKEVVTANIAPSIKLKPTEKIEPGVKKEPPYAGQLSLIECYN